jgi:hypothetical protein
LDQKTDKGGCKCVCVREIEKDTDRERYRAFHQFRLTKFAYGGLVLANFSYCSHCLKK